MIIKGFFSTDLHKNVCCGYSLESPWRGDSNDYPCFYGEIWKSSLIIIKYPPYLFFTIVHNLENKYYRETGKVGIWRKYKDYFPDLSTETSVVGTN